MIKKYAKATITMYDGIQWDGKARTQSIITEWIPESDIRMNAQKQIEIIEPETGRELYADVGSIILKNERGRVFVLTGYNVENNFTEV